MIMMNDFVARLVLAVKIWNVFRLKIYHGIKNRLGTQNRCVQWKIIIPNKAQ